MRIGHRTFGAWVVDLDYLTLDLTDGVDLETERYAVDLERCTSSGEVLDWIFQVQDKGWATPDVVAGLISALQATLDPQATLCSFGRSTPLRVTKKGVRARLISYLVAADTDNELSALDRGWRVISFGELREIEGRHTERWEAVMAEGDP